MNIYILFAIGAFIISAVCGFAFIPMILNFCKQRRLYDIPNQRKVHSVFVPRLGGLAFLPSMIISVALVLFMLLVSQGEEITLHIWSIYFLLGLSIIYATGFIDDIVGLSPMVKFLAQIVAAIFLPVAGLYVNNLYGFCGVWEVPSYVGMPLTVFIIVFIVNSINLIDGIDGLSAGLSVLALMGFVFLFGQQQVWAYVILIAGIIGVLVTYLYYNIWGDPEKNRKIFMGDSGSLTLGYILSFLFIKYTMDNPLVMPYRKDGLLLSFTLLIVPVFDVVRVIIVRLKNHRGVFEADKNHIHHKLMRAGLSQHGALLVILGFALFYCVLNFLLSKVMLASVVVAIDIVIYLVFHLVVDRQIVKNGKKAFD